MKDIKDYLHLYLGCEVRVQKKLGGKDPLVKGYICEVTKESNHGDWVMVYFTSVVDFMYHNFNKRSSNQHTFFMEEDHIKLVLRPLSDITPEEYSERCLARDSGKTIMEAVGEDVRYLLSKGFDLFGLIEAGLAIDKTTLKQNA